MLPATMLHQRYQRPGSPLALKLSIANCFLWFFATTESTFVINPGAGMLVGTVARKVFH